MQFINKYLLSKLEITKKRRKKNESKLPKLVLMNFEHVCFLGSFKKVTKQFSFLGNLPFVNLLKFQYFTIPPIRHFQ